MFYKDTSVKKWFKIGCEWKERISTKSEKFTVFHTSITEKLFRFVIFVTKVLLITVNYIGF